MEGSTSRREGGMLETDDRWQVAALQHAKRSSLTI
jgi:hypothetical protein